MADIFNISRRPARGIPAGAADDATGGGGGEGGGGGGEHKIGVFITAQSLATFPVASAVIAVIWNVLGALVEGWAKNKVVPFVVALIIGMVIYLLSADKGQTAGEKAGKFVIALINSFLLAAAALGIGSAAAALGIGIPGGANPTPTP